MTQEDAEAVARWHYPEPFSFYDWHTDDLSELLDPRLRADDFVAVDDDSGNLVGYFHYKPPHHPSLEIGLGMHPDWTGRGLGQSFVEAGLDYARRRYAPEEFLLSVATFNDRAIAVYKRVGFVRRRTYAHWTLGRDWEFIEMRRPARSLRMDECRRVEEGRGRGTTRRK